MMREEGKMSRIQRLRGQLQQLSTMDMCVILVTCGFTLLVLARFLDPYSMAAVVVQMGGSVLFLSGMAMFVAIARSVLDE
jgi:hypothetical protein